ncbi:MAG: hypothetical protein ACI4JW_06870 [Oscillospiraceae bacterium]
MGVSIKAEIYVNNGIVTLERAVSFRFVKERYTPYSQLSGVFIGEVEPQEIKQVTFYLNGKVVHSGMADSVICEKSGGKRLVRIKSYGFSMLLGQNQAEPGIIGSPDLKAVITKCLPIYGVSYQTQTAAVNYVYINEKSSIWDAACVYAMKAYQNMPFIYGTNGIRCTRSGEKLFEYVGDTILSVRKGISLTGVVSHAYTQDINGDWVYSSENGFAVDRHITNQKYLARDKEWAYDMNKQLDYKIYNSEKGCVFSSFTYAGFKNEDLLDHASIVCGDFSLDDAEIDRVEVVGTKKGVYTTLSFYNDRFCPMS